MAKDLAFKKIERINIARDRDREQYIAKELVRLNTPTRWTKFFGASKPVTRLDILSREENGWDNWDNQLWIIDNWRYRESYELATRILVAVQFGDPIHLTLEDMERLGR